MCDIYFFDGRLGDNWICSVFQDHAFHSAPELGEGLDTTGVDTEAAAHHARLKVSLFYRDSHCLAPAQALYLPVTGWKDWNGTARWKWSYWLIFFFFLKDSPTLRINSVFSAVQSLKCPVFVKMHFIWCKLVYTGCCCFFFFFCVVDLTLT